MSRAKKENTADHCEGIMVLPRHYSMTNILPRWTYPTSIDY